MKGNEIKLDLGEYTGALGELTSMNDVLSEKGPYEKMVNSILEAIENNDYYDGKLTPANKKSETVKFYLELRDVRNELRRIQKNGDELEVRAHIPKVIKVINSFVKILERQKNRSDRYKSLLATNDNIEQLNKAKDVLNNVCRLDWKTPINLNLQQCYNVLKKFKHMDDIIDIDGWYESMLLIIQDALECETNYEKQNKTNDRSKTKKLYLELKNTVKKLFKIQSSNSTDHQVVRKHMLEVIKIIDSLVQILKKQENCSNGFKSLLATPCNIKQLENIKDVLIILCEKLDWTKENKIINLNLEKYYLSALYGLNKLNAVIARYDNPYHDMLLYILGKIERNDFYKKKLINNEKGETIKFYFELRKASEKLDDLIRRYDGNYRNYQARIRTNILDVIRIIDRFVKILEKQKNRPARFKSLLATEYNIRQLKLAISILKKISKLGYTIYKKYNISDQENNTNGDSIIEIIDE